MLVWLKISFIAAYPVLLHLAIWLQQPLLQVVAIIVLSVGILLSGLLQKNKIAWTLLIFLILVSVVTGLYDITLYVMYLPPILIPLVIGSVFAKTLLPGQEPLVTSIGEQARGPLSDEMRSYTRKVTWAWAIVLGCMVVLAIYLPLFASDFTWSIFTNVINYLFIGLLFVGEFVYRKYRFPDHRHPNFVEYITIVVKSQMVKRG